MSFSLSTVLLWAASFFGNAALLFVLLFRRRWRVVPWFTGWIVFHLGLTLILFAAYHMRAQQAYVLVFWAGAFVDLLLQIGIIIEIAGYVYRRRGAWVGSSRKRLFACGIGASLAATAMGFALKPAYSSRLEALDARADFGSTVFISLVFMAVMVISQQLGLSWRSLILREGYGVALWSIFAFAMDMLHTYGRMPTYFILLDQLQTLGYVVVLVYWCVVFWIPEEALLVPTENDKKIIEALLRELE